MTDRVELLTQTGGTLQKVGIKTYNISAGINHYNKNYNVYIAMSQTLRRRIKLEYWQKFIQNIDLVIIDEAHKQEFNYLFESFVDEPFKEDFQTLLESIFEDTIKLGVSFMMEAGADALIIPNCSFETLKIISNWSTIPVIVRTESILNKNELKAIFDLGIKGILFSEKILVIEGFDDKIKSMQVV